MPNKYNKETIQRAKDLREKQGLKWIEIADRLQIPTTTIKTWAQQNSWANPPLIDAQLMGDPTDPHIQAQEDLERKLQGLKAVQQKERTIHKALQHKYDQLVTQTQLADLAGSPNISPIKVKNKNGTTEGAILMVASDWHVEEVVRPETVGMLNEYNSEIAKQRAKKFFQSGLRLTQIIDQDINVTSIILPLLGDFITNDIHDELKEITDKLPMEAISQAQDYIASGIKFLLENSDYKLIIPCHSGNHGRTTKTTHFTSEYGHSLEYFMYKNLERFFASEDRVEFNIATSYHSYLDIYGVMIRFHHGHAVRYAGGVGGIYIPLLKAISSWNRAKHADLDILAHFHQLRDGHVFLSNGSNIGYSGYSVSIKADYEKPRQAFTVIDSKRGRTWTAPISVV